MRIGRPPSSALYPPVGQGEPAAGLTALGERLTFTCSGNGCRVEAEYRVRAEAAGRFAFEFVLPAGQPVTVEVGEERLGARTVPAEPYSAREQLAFPWAGEGRVPGDLELHRARFEGALPSGEGRIRVSYFQPHSSFELGHGYFSKGRFVDTVDYEIWPLGEWPRAEGFRIELEVRMSREPPAWWTRNPRSLACHGVTRVVPRPEEVQTFTRSQPVPGEPRQEGDRLVLRAVLGPELPDSLSCSFGAQDLLR
jgi:hypothetical protein